MLFGQKLRPLVQHSRLSVSSFSWKIQEGTKCSTVFRVAQQNSDILRMASPNGTHALVIEFYVFSTQCCALRSENVMLVEWPSTSERA